MIWALAAGSAALLFLYGVHLVVLSWRALRLRPAAAPAGAGEPSVCVQLPLYNERHVAARAVAAACALEWPRERFEVQVLDDSTDGTPAIVAGEIARARAAGVRVHHVRRASREGFKAGALAHGLDRTGAELIYIFDADFVPAPDFVRRTAGAFADPRVGWVQARWGHLNEGYSLFTRLQALMIDFHFLIEQPVRAAAGWPTNFTGTAGAWRREAIVDAGGWSARTLTEDLDLSYRAQLRGWRGAYLEDVVVPQELPATVAGYRGQQSRWSAGSFQSAAALLPAIWRSRLTPVQRVEASVHLLAYCAPLLMLVQVLLFPVLLDFGSAPALPGALILVNLVSLAPVAGMAVAQARRGRGARRQARRGRGAWRRLPAAAAWTLVGAATSATVAAGLLRALRGGGVFNRTPKYRLESAGGEWRSSDYAIAFDSFALVELALGAVCGAIAIVSARRGQPLMTAYSTLFAAGFLFLGGTAIHQALSVLRLRRRVPAAALLLVPAAGLMALVASFGEPFEDGYAHWLLAANLVTTGALRDPLFAMQDAWLPGYTIFAAGVLGLAGTWSIWALHAANAAIGLVTLVLTHRLAGGERRGILAAALLALNPIFLVTETSAVAEPLLVACLLGAVLALRTGRTGIAAALAAAACLTGTKAWIWIGVLVAGQLLLHAPPRAAPTLRWAVPALAVLALLQLGFAPATHSMARAAVEAGSAGARGSVAPGGLDRLAAFTGYFALASLPALALAGAAAGLRRRAAWSADLALPSAGYLAAACALVAAGAYTGSHRYYLPALPAVAIAAATALDAVPALLASAPVAAAGLLLAGYLPVVAALGGENAGLAAAGRASAAIPGRLLTDSPVAAYYSGRPPAAISGSRVLPGTRDAAIDWLRAHGYEALVVERVDYYRATTSLPDLAAGRAEAPFRPAGDQAVYNVAGGKPVGVYGLPPGDLRAAAGGPTPISLRASDLPSRGKTAPIVKGAVLLGPDGRDLAGEGVGFGVPLVQSGERWLFPGSATTVDVGLPEAPHWRRVYELDLAERDAADGRFVAFDRVPSAARVEVDYVLTGGRAQVTARVVAGRADSLVLLNEESAAFDDLAAAAGSWRGSAIGPWRPLDGGWGRLRSARDGIEFSVLDPSPGSRLRGGRELGGGLDWAGIEVEAAPGATQVNYSLEVQRAR